MGFLELYYLNYFSCIRANIHNHIKGRKTLRFRNHIIDLACIDTIFVSSLFMRMFYNQNNDDK